MDKNKYYAIMEATIQDEIINDASFYNLKTDFDPEVETWPGMRVRYSVRPSCEESVADIKLKKIESSPCLLVPPKQKSQNYQIILNDKIMTVNGPEKSASIGTAKGLLDNNGHFSENGNHIANGSFKKSDPANTEYVRKLFEKANSLHSHEETKRTCVPKAP